MSTVSTEAIEAAMGILNSDTITIPLVDEVNEAAQNIADNIEAHEAIAVRVEDAEALVNPHYGAIDNIGPVVAYITNVNDELPAILRVDLNESKIIDVADAIPNIGTVAEAISTNTLTDIIAGLPAIDIANNGLPNITLVANDISGIQAVAPYMADVIATGQAIIKVALVADEMLRVKTVADHIEHVHRVHGSIGAIDNISLNLQKVLDVADAAAVLLDNIDAINVIVDNVTDINYFADLWLGPKAVEPTVKNDGLPLLAGDLYFNTVSETTFQYTGSRWTILGTILDVTSITDTFTATEGQTVFNTSEPYGLIRVFMNGHKLIIDEQVELTTASSFTLLGITPVAGDKIEAVIYGMFNIADHYTKTEMDTILLDYGDMFKTTYDTAGINEQLLGISATQTITNKTITDISNNVHADAVHFKIKANEALLKGQPLVMTGYNSGENAAEVSLANQATDVTFALAQEDILSGEIGTGIQTGVLHDIDTDAWPVNTLLYVDGTGILTSTEPATGISQPVGRVLRQNANNGHMAVSVTRNKQVAGTVRFVANGDIAAITVQDAIVEVRDDTDTKLGFKLDKTGGIISSDLTVSGNFTVNGTTTQVNSTEVSTADNIIVLNDGEAGAGVTAGSSGLEVDRGTETNYEFKFDETDDSFKVGEIGSLQKVATREDTPTDTGVAVWDAATSKFLTTRAVNVDSIVVSGNVDGRDVSADGIKLDNTYSQTEVNTIRATIDKYAKQRIVITPTADADYTLTDEENKYGYLEIVDGAWTSGHSIWVGGEERSIVVDTSGCSYSVGVEAGTSGVYSPPGLVFTVYFDGTDVESDSRFYTKTEVVNFLAGKANLSGAIFTGLVAYDSNDFVTNIDCSLGNSFTKTVSGSFTVTFSNVPTTGNACIIVIKLKDAATGAAVITWPGVVWPGGEAPDFSAAGFDTVVLYTVDGGTIWYGNGNVGYA